MPQARYDLNLSKKSISADRSAELRMKDLDRNGAPMTNVVSEIHGRHSAPADFTLDDVSAGKCFVQE
jgi:hypothetical protein